MAAERRCLKDHETPVLKRTTAGVAGIFDCADVFFHGTYDVGLAAAVIF